MPRFVVPSSLPRAVATAALIVASAVSAAAQSTQMLDGPVQGVITASKTTGLTYNDPIYIADRTAGSNYSGIVNLWFRNAAGAVLYACSGSYLGGGKILTAAHCVSNGTSNLAASFTARFYQTGTGWVDVSGTGMVAKPGYSGAVVEERDVAVLTLGSAAPSFSRSYSLAVGNVLGNVEEFAGYGRTGDGSTGAAFTNNQFNDLAVLRRGKQVFESTCNTAGFCATSLHPAPNTFGGILLSDMDVSGVSTASFVCGALGFCGAGIAGFEEVGIGPGDSGGASFNADWTVTGVASFGSTRSGVTGYFGAFEGHTCVAKITGNAACTSNYDWVRGEVVPEPATVGLVAIGLVGMFGFARRRRLS